MTRALSGTLSTDLANNVLTLCRCWQITKTNGDIVRLTDHDQNLTFQSNTFYSDGGFSISALESAENLAVDNADMTVLFKTSLVTDAEIVGGLYDNASVKVWLVNYENTANYCALPGGTLTKIQTTEEDKAVFELASLSSKLNQNIGRIVAPTCDADFGDTRCGISLAAYTVTGTITAVTNNGKFTDSSRAESANYFNFGKFTFTSGNNNGLSFEIFDFGSGVFTLVEPTPYDVEVGDTYSAIRGCDKLKATCIAYGNYDNFRGFPFNISNSDLLAGPK